MELSDIFDLRAFESQFLKYKRPLIICLGCSFPMDPFSLQCNLMGKKSHQIQIFAGKVTLPKLFVWCCIATKVHRQRNKCITFFDHESIQSLIRKR